MQDWQIILAAFVAYWAVIAVLGKFKILERINCKSWGPILTIRTERGKRLMDRLSRPQKFWHWFGVVSIAICAVVAPVFLVTRAMMLPQIFEVKEPIDPRLMFVIPGINPIFPLFYGLLGLFIGMLVHEGAHGILMRRHDITLKSFGLLFILFPIGAFTEPEEEELLKAKRSHRAKIYSSGPGMNIILAVVVLLVSMAMISTVSSQTSGLIPSKIHADMEEYYPDGLFAVLEIDGVATTSPDDIELARKVGPGDHSLKIFSASSGMEYIAVRVKNESLGLGLGFQGWIKTGLFDVPFNTVEGFRSLLANPFNNFALFVGLPFERYQPIPSGMTQFYDVPMGDSFWVIYNCLYWIFWVNILLGLFNALPIFPFDGGWLFRDFATFMAKKFTDDEDKAETAAGRITSGVSVLTLALLFAPLIIPWIMQLIP